MIGSSLNSPFQTVILPFHFILPFLNHPAKTAAVAHSWDGILTKDGARGGSRRAILHPFNRSWDDDSALDMETCNSVTKTRWLELGRVHKLCNNSQNPKRGEPGHDPAHKFSFICDAFSASVSAITKTASLDQCGDETSWPHSGHGEAKSGLTGPTNGKPGVSRGGQVVMVSDREHFRPRAFLHRHKLHDFAFSFAEPSGMCLMWEKLKPFCEGVDVDDPNKPKALFSQLPHFTVDNCFSADCIMECAAKEGFGSAMTCHRD